MPYISDVNDKRSTLNVALIHNPYIDKAQNAGELNYQITCLFIAYLRQHGLNYQNINDCVGAAHSAVAEFQRRVVGPYEDTKIIANGDVYPETSVDPVK